METIGANGLRVVPTDMSSLDRSLGNMKSICWQRVWRWRFGKASGVEDKPLCSAMCRRPSAPLSKLFYVRRTPPLYVAATEPCKNLQVFFHLATELLEWGTEYLIFSHIYVFDGNYTKHTSTLGGEVISPHWGAEANLLLLFMNR